MRNTAWQKTFTMVVSCCVVECRKWRGEWPRLGWFSFPIVPEERRWIDAVRKIGNQPYTFLYQVNRLLEVRKPRHRLTFFKQL